MGYDERTRVLEIEFTTGAVYQYLDVPPGEYESLDTAPSKGRGFNSKIKDRYRFIRLA